MSKEKSSVKNIFDQPAKEVLVDKIIDNPELAKTAARIRAMIDSDLPRSQKVAATQDDKAKKSTSG